MASGVVGQSGAEQAGALAARHYVSEFPENILTPEIQRLFEEYSKLPREEIKKHIELVRDKAWKLFPYCCIGRFTFVEFGVSRAPQYAEVLTRIKDGEKYLDVGCFLGQDIRRLVYDGAPPLNLIGTDVEPAFFPLGHDLFKDAESLTTPFIASDLLNPDDSALDHLTDTIAIIHASSVFHLFDWNGQVALGLKCTKLLKKQPGSMIFGRQAGNLMAHEADHPRGDGKMFRHNQDSWRHMWQDIIGPRTGTKWQVHVDMDAERPDWLVDRRAEGHRRTRFVCIME